MPPESTVEIRCALPNNSDPYWSVDIQGDGNQKQFTSTGRQIQTLNDYGFYELPRLNGGMLPTIRMLINDTTVINGTRIRCNGANVRGELLLILYGELIIIGKIIVVCYSMSTNQSIMHLQSSFIISSKDSTGKFF